MTDLRYDPNYEDTKIRVYVKDENDLCVVCYKSDDFDNYIIKYNESVLFTKTKREDVVIRLENNMSKFSTLKSKYEFLILWNYIIKIETIRKTIQ